MSLSSLRPIAVANDSGEPVLWCEVLAGSRLREVCFTALTLAVSMHCTVRFEFNEVVYIVDPEEFMTGWML